jgi:hypothetical protein
MAAYDRTALRRWAADEAGGLAVMFALIAIPILGIVAAAIDFGRAGKVRDTMSVALAAAAEAASLHLYEEKDVVEGHARRMLKANLPEHLRELPFELTIAPDYKSVGIAMEASVPTTLMAIMGKSEIKVAATGHARSPVLAGPPSPLAAAGPAPALPSGRPRPDDAAVEAAVRELQHELSRLQRQLGDRGRVDIDVDSLARELRSRLR